MWIGLLAIILSAAIGGSVNSVAVKIGGREFTPIVFTAIRFLLSTLVLLPFFLSQKGSKLYTTDKKVLLLMSLLFALNIVLFSVGLQFTSAIMGQLLYVLSPILVIVFAHFLIGEKYTREKGIGLVIALSGVGFLLYQSITRQATLTFGTPLGNSLVLLGVVCTALYFVLARRLSHSYSGTTITFINFLITLVFVVCVLPLGYVLFPHHTIIISQQGILSIGAIVVSSTLAYLLQQSTIKRTSAFVGSLSLYMSPFFTALTAIFLLGEKITLPFVVGGTLIALGVFYATAYHHVKQLLKSREELVEN
ncbi:MAG TPA: DMT family transporter [Candidatus Eisenbacteria bacterium]|nr:DMT family transporter [Candidatus Eisenbacteria bacterium]